MDDKYKINAARTEMREAYLSGDTDRLLAIFHPDGFTDMSEGSPSRYGGDARVSLAEEAKKLFASYSVKFVPIIIEISVMDAVAFDRGWHEFILAAESGRGNDSQALPVFQYVEESAERRLEDHVARQQYGCSRAGRRGSEYVVLE